MLPFTLPPAEEQEEDEEASGRTTPTCSDVKRTCMICIIWANWSCFFEKSGNRSMLCGCVLWLANTSVPKFIVDRRLLMELEKLLLLLLSFSRDKLAVALSARAFRCATRWARAASCFCSPT
jgi:hypothetical protein